MGPGDYMYLNYSTLPQKNPSLNTNLVEVPIFCRSYLLEINTTIEFDDTFIFPFQIFIYSNENDKGLTTEQSLLCDVSIKRSLVRLVTIHSYFGYYARTLKTSLGLN